MHYKDIPYEDCPNGTEGELLLFALDRVHREFAWKSGGLTSEQLGTKHPPSGVTVAGTMVHLAKVEEMWTASAAGRAVGQPVIGADGEEHDNSEWQEVPRLPPEDLYSLWYGTITRCRQEWTGPCRRRRARRPMHRRSGLRGQSSATADRYPGRELVAHRPDIDHPRGDRRARRQRRALIEFNLPGKRSLAEGP